MLTGTLAGVGYRGSVHGSAPYPIPAKAGIQYDKGSPCGRHSIRLDSRFRGSGTEGIAAI